MFEVTIYHGWQSEEFPYYIIKYLKDKYGAEFEDGKLQGRLAEKSFLVISQYERIIFLKFDGGEPEDQTFGRDLSYIPEIVMMAYKMRFEDGK
jgi:hypothetical protein